MFEATISLLLSGIVPFSLGLFFYVISPVIRRSDTKMADVSRKSGIAIIIIVSVWIMMNLLKIIF